VLAWIAAQPWCTGSVGIFGKSWGGFNALQIAARRPPPLKAVIAMHFTDDRYNDDVHYMGGCLLTSQMLAWAAVMFAANAAPPDPRFVGERWREMWLERMEKTPPYIEAWLSHQRKDDYWKHGSVSEDYSAIEIPVYAVGGWADAYNNSIPRLLAGLSGQRKGIIGPWSHNFPETGVPSPAIGFLQESLRWWDHWLKGKETGIMDEPMLRCWMPEAVRPAPFYAERPGRWVAEPSWPSPNIREQTYFLNNESQMEMGRFRDSISPSPNLPISILGRQNHGLNGGEWGGLGYPGEPAGDQRAADGQSLAFTSQPLTEPVEILGYPEVDLALAADRPLALVSVRLCDVAPAGASTLVSWGLLNLTHRESHETPTPLEPGRRYDVTVRLNVKAYRLPAGHRWRVSISPTNFRHAWPSPQPVTLQLFAGADCRLRLPVRPPQPADADLPPFGPAEVSPPLPIETLRNESRQQFLRRDMVNGVTEMVLDGDNGRICFSNTGMITEDVGRETLTIRDGDPLSLVDRVRRTLRYEREDWRIRIETDSKLTADAHSFYVTCLMEGYENDTRVFIKSWNFTIQRDLM
jgi:putative CocE/NonD family hydrolase